MSINIKYQKIVNYLKKIIFDDQIILIVLSFFIAILAAYTAILFRYSFESLQKYFYGTHLDSSFINLENIPWFLIMIVTTTGGLVVGFFIYFFMPYKKSTGVANAGLRVGGAAGRT